MKLKWLQKNPLKQGRILEGWGEFFWLARIYSPAFRSNLWVAESFAGKGLVIKGKIIVFFHNSWRKKDKYDENALYFLQLYIYNLLSMIIALPTIHEL